MTSKRHAISGRNRSSGDEPSLLRAVQPVAEVSKAR